MKKIFFWLLRQYSKNEKGRIEILRAMDEQVRNNYREQNAYGNVYNYFIEFVMASPFIIKQVSTNDKLGINVLRNGILSSFNDAIKYIEEVD